MKMLHIASQQSHSVYDNLVTFFYEQGVIIVCHKIEKVTIRGINQYTSHITKCLKFLSILKLFLSFSIKCSLSRQHPCPPTSYSVDCLCCANSINSKTLVLYVLHFSSILEICQQAFFNYSKYKVLCFKKQYLFEILADIDVINLRT